MSARVDLSEPLLLDEAELTEWWPRASKIYYHSWGKGRKPEERVGWDWREWFETNYPAKAAGFVKSYKFDEPREYYQRLLERSLIVGYEV